MRLAPLLLPFVFATACSEPETRGELFAQFGGNSGARFVVDDGTVFAYDGWDIVVIDGSGTRVLAAQPGPIARLALDDHRLYTMWTDIQALPRAGGPLTMVAADQFAHGFAVDDEAVYWGASGFGATRVGLWRQLLAGGEPESLVPGVVGHFQLDGGRVYWCQDDGCWSKDRRGGDATLAFAVTPTDGWLVAGGKLYYGARSGDAPPDELRMLSGPAATPEVLARTQTDWNDEELAANGFGAILAAPDGRVYAATGNRIFEVSGDDLAATFMAATQVQLDQTHAYWMEGDAIFRIAR